MAEFDSRLSKSRRVPAACRLGSRSEVLPSAGAAAKNPDATPVTLVDPGITIEDVVR